jgi:hypothetical protein
MELPATRLEEPVRLAGPADAGNGRKAGIRDLGSRRALGPSPATGGAPGQVAGDRRSTQRAQEKQERKMLDTEYTEHTEKSMKG